MRSSSLQPSPKIVPWDRLLGLKPRTSFYGSASVRRPLPFRNFPSHPAQRCSESNPARPKLVPPTSSPDSPVIRRRRITLPRGCMRLRGKQALGNVENTSSQGKSLISGLYQETYLARREHRRSDKRLRFASETNEKHLFAHHYAHWSSTPFDFVILLR